MTAKKANPAKRGRKPVTALARRRVLARWERFKEGAGSELDDLSAPERARLFLEANSAWFKTIGIPRSRGPA